MRWPRPLAVLALLCKTVTACKSSAQEATPTRGSGREVAVEGDCNAIGDSSASCVFNPAPSTPATASADPLVAACTHMLKILDKIDIAPQDSQQLPAFYRELASDLVDEAVDAPGPLADWARNFAKHFRDRADAQAELLDALGEVDFYTRLGRPLTPAEQQSSQAEMDKAQAAQKRFSDLGDQGSTYFDDLRAVCV
ncbi:hypothetical protein ACIBG8_09260 [Nonomuraea sp. NPDC050556]|uniref:hypothetical protein n=1 Tax=Nonomuraea sp. NPDC050556 TaxID=3364369 RepID=UPI003788E34F